MATANDNEQGQNTGGDCIVERKNTQGPLERVSTTVHKEPDGEEDEGRKARSDQRRNTPRCDDLGNTVL